MSHTFQRRHKIVPWQTKCYLFRNYSISNKFYYPTNLEYYSFKMNLSLVKISYYNNACLSHSQPTVGSGTCPSFFLVYFTTGVSKAEILIFHTMTLCCVSFVQIVELFTLSFFIFKLDCKGEKVFAFLLTYLQSIIGICFGTSRKTRPSSIVPQELFR